jgi:serine protease Do
MFQLSPMRRAIGAPPRPARAAAAALLGFVFTFGAAAAPMPESFAPLAERVTPAVVTISGIHRVSLDDQGAGDQGANDQGANGQAGDGLPFDFPKGSPFGELFKQFRERQRPGSKGPGEGRGPIAGVSLGSGFIVDAGGYIVTNNHVIADAEDIQVKLADAREYKARVVGTDAQTDLALLKIEAAAPLTAVEFADSDQLKVGDWVMAVGNPFGLGGTVTVGVLSARGRDIKSGPYDDFLQIDASINQGNSGGPSFNTEGKVIGINTAIVSPSGGNVGIGFATPANVAKPVIEQLRAQGRIERGWLGVSVQPVTPEIAKAIGLTEPAGALVAQVVPGGPAAAAALKPGDVVLAFAGAPVKTVRDLPRLVAQARAGAATELVVWRDHARTTVAVDIGKQPQPQQNARTGDDGQPADGQPADGPVASAQLGAKLAALTPALRRQLGMKDGVAGVLVVAVTDADPRHDKLRRGDVIQRVDHAAIAKPADIDRLVKVAQAEDRKAVLLQVLRQGQILFVGLAVA